MAAINCFIIAVALLPFLGMATANAIVAADAQTCVIHLTNGCSVPLNAPFPYKELFTPACLKHDICYSCGKSHNWTRDDCDRAFKVNMKSLCYLKEAAKTTSTYSFWLWDRLKAVFTVVTEMAKWLLIDAGSIDHCLHGAKVYYEAVDNFAHGNYGTGHKQCSTTCAKSIGDPLNYI